MRRTLSYYALLILGTTTTDYFGNDVCPELVQSGILSEPGSHIDNEQIEAFKNALITYLVQHGKYNGLHVLVRL